MVSIRITGVKEAQAELRRIARLAPDLMEQALRVEAQKMLDASRPLVPVDTGVLMASGLIEPPQNNGGKVRVVFGYGGSAWYYAIPQHERTDYHHRRGQDHYLSEPVLSMAGGMGPRLAETLRGFFTGAVRQVKGPTFSSLPTRAV